VYQEIHGLPNNLLLRKPDPWLKAAVESSYALKRSTELEGHFNSNLLFFEEAMTKDHIGKTLRLLHSDHLTGRAKIDYKIKLEELSNKLQN